MEIVSFSNNWSVDIMLLKIDWGGRGGGSVGRLRKKIKIQLKFK